MKVQHIFLLIIFVFCFQGCSASGPTHFYPGEKHQPSETARLSVPGPISVTKIDGKEADIPSKEDGFYEIYLLPGLHRIEFKYELYWGDPSSGMIVTSDDVGIETPFRAGKNYVLSYPIPEDEEEAYEMANVFKAKLTEQETGRVVFSRALAELDERGIKTTLLYGNSEATKSRDNNTPIVESTAIKPPAGIDADTAAREDTVRRLKFWWLMADEEERIRFKKWMKSTEVQDSGEK